MVSYIGRAFLTRPALCGICLFVCFHLCCAACGIFLPHSGMEPWAPSLEAVLIIGPPGSPASTVRITLSCLPSLLFSTWNSTRYTNALNKLVASLSHQALASHPPSGCFTQWRRKRWQDSHPSPGLSCHPRWLKKWDHPGSQIHFTQHLISVSCLGRPGLQKRPRCTRLRRASRELQFPHLQLEGAWTSLQAHSPLLFEERKGFCCKSPL